MRSRFPHFVRTTLAACCASAALLVIAPAVSAQTAPVEECIANGSTQTTPTRPLDSDGQYLLARDGTGFFTSNLDTIVIRSASAHAEAIMAANDVAAEVTDFFLGTNVEVVVNGAGSAARTVVVDGEIAVPASPSVFTVGGVDTLYLHWSTAHDDIVRLLDQPSFGALVVDPPAPDEGCDRPVTDTAAVQSIEEPTDLLAYVDGEPDDELPVAADDLQSVPLATGSPTFWPFAAGAAALVAFGGTTLALRRKRGCGDWYTSEVEPAEMPAEAPKPKYPVADLPPSLPPLVQP